jgi:hypothetical protein
MPWDRSQSPLAGVALSLGWIVAGALAGLCALLAISSLFPLLVIAVPACLLAGRHLLRRSRLLAPRWWAAGGASVFPFFLAYQNRHGPGTYCHPIGTPPFPGQECGDYWDPRPFLAAGVLLCALAVAGFAASSRRGRLGVGG